MVVNQKMTVSKLVIEIKLTIKPVEIAGERTIEQPNTECKIEQNSCRTMTRQEVILCYYELNISSNSAVSLTKAKGDPLRAAQAATIIRILPDSDQVANQTIGQFDSRLSAILPCSNKFLNCLQHLFQAIQQPNRIFTKSQVNGTIGKKWDTSLCLCAFLLPANKEIRYSLIRKIRKKQKTA